MKESRIFAEKMLDIKKENRSSRIGKNDSSQPSGSFADRVQFLQRTIGNQDVGRLINSGTLKAGLRIGQPGDEYGQEADRVADTVMRMPESRNFHEPVEPLIQKMCPGCEEEKLKRQPKEEEEEELMTKADNAPDIAHNLESSIHGLIGRGRPLEESMRTFFEPRFGHDFSRVRVHADTKADMLNRMLSARAFTTGQDIFFRQGEYNPCSSDGKKLLAHELTHVVQQSGGGNEILSRKEKEANEPEIIDVSDDTVYRVSDKNAIKRTPPSALKSTGKIPWDSQVKIKKRYEKDSASFVFVAKAYGDKGDWGWTSESNIEVSDVPTEERYGCIEAKDYFIKNGEYLQQDTIDALGNIDNPIEVKNKKGEVTDSYYLRLTECMYPSSFSHVSRGHYTGHCVDIGFADNTGANKTYSGEAKKTIEKQGKNAFDSIVKHSDHFHGCVSLADWVESRTTAHLKELLKERKDEY